MKMFATACALLACIASAGSQAQGVASPAPGVPGEILPASGVPAAQVAGDVDSVASPLIGLVDFVPQTILDYCMSAAPELRAELRGESASFRAKSHRAVAPYVNRLAVDGAALPGPSDAELDAMRQMMLASLAKNEPHGYCSAYVVKLRDADVDALAAAAWEKYQALAAAAKAHGAQ